MKPSTPNGIKALRAVSIAVTLISLAVIGSVLYSAYIDYSAVRNEFGAGSTARPSVHILVQGTDRVVTLNFTVNNRGFYPLDVSLSCLGPTPNIVCYPATVSVPAGQQRMLIFQFTVGNYIQYTTPGSLHINGTIGVMMGPFADLKIGTDFGSLAAGGA